MDSIVVEPNAPESRDDKYTDIVSWVMSNVQRNRQERDQVYKERWDEYYRVWRGRWTPTSRSRASERSRLVSPATQIAVDIKLADIIEAVLGREQWFDISDDLKDQERTDAIAARDQLTEDLYNDGIINFLAEVLLIGALYGQLSGKVVVDVKQEAQALRTPSGKLIRGYKERASIFPVAIEPGQLVWDMSGPTKTDRMLGVAHEFRLGIHTINERIANGVYLEADVGPAVETTMSTAERGEEGENQNQQDSAFITEWHGLVPTRLLAAIRGAGAPGLEVMLDGVPDDDMQEAIVTIANEGTLLRAIPNPSVMEDRAIVSEQYDTVPNRFIGRGDVEKAYNSQKGNDVELRARADTLAWINNPMMAGDITRLPPKMDLNAWPGKFWGTRGNPAEVIQEFRFGDVNMSTFQQTAEFERMIAQSIGAHDSTTLRGGVRDESAMGSGIAASGMIKRSKRTMFNIETFLNNLLRRIMWRKMQFDPERYPQDFVFTVKGTIGILAREVEMAHMTHMLQYVPEGSPAQLVLIKSLYEMSSSPKKAEMVAAVEQMMQPDPAQQELQMLQQQLVFAELQSKINLNNAKAMEAAAASGVKGAEKMLKEIQAQIEWQNKDLERINAMIEAQFAQVAMKQVVQNDRELDIKAAKVRVDAIKARKPSSK